MTVTSDNVPGMGTVRRLAAAAGDVTLGQAAEAYLATLRGAEQASTRRTYGRILRWVVAEFGAGFLRIFLSHLAPGSGEYDMVRRTSGPAQEPMPAPSPSCDFSSRRILRQVADAKASTPITTVAVSIVPSGPGRSTARRSGT